MWIRKDWSPFFTSFFFFCNLWRNSEEETKQLNGDSFFYYLDYLPKARAQNWEPPKAYELSVPNCCNVVRRDRKNPQDYRWIWAFGGKWRQLYWADFYKPNILLQLGGKEYELKSTLGPSKRTFPIWINYRSKILFFVLCGPNYKINFFFVFIF